MSPKLPISECQEDMQEVLTNCRYSLLPYELQVRSALQHMDVNDGYEGKYQWTSEECWNNIYLKPDIIGKLKLSLGKEEKESARER